MTFTEEQTIALYGGIALMTFILMWAIIGRRSSKWTSLELIVSNRIKVKIADDAVKTISYSLVPILWYWVYSARSFSVGTDTYNYFARYSEGGNSLKEPVFFLFNSLGNALGLDFGQFLAVWCVFTTFFVLNGLRYFLDDNWIGIFVGATIYYFEFFFIGMNAMRQITAATILFYAIKYLDQKRYGRYVIWCLIATGIHLTAAFGMIFLGVYVIVYGNQKKGQFGYYAFLVFGSILGYPLLILVNELFGVKYGVQTNGIGIGFLRDYILPLLFIAVYLLNRNIHDQKTQLMIDIFLLIIPFRLIGYLSTPLMRMAYYPAMIQIVVVPRIADKINKKSVRNIIWAFIVIAYFVQFLIIGINTNGVSPYGLPIE